MPYSEWDEYFIHQLPRTLDQVGDSDPSFSDRCYFNIHANDGSLLVVTGYGNNPNGQFGRGYAKAALADGRHIDFMATRDCIGDRGDLFAGPMRWTCVEPLKRWRLELGPNPSGLEYDVTWEAYAPLWELLPITIRKRGRPICDFTHIKQPGRYTGWVKIDGETIDVAGFHGGRDRTFGVRVAQEIDFWIWFEAGFGDQAIEAWVFESADGTVQYCDGGITHADGTLSKRFVKFEHEIEFDGDRKRPLKAQIVFTDEDGQKIRVDADSPHPHVGVYYGPLTRKQYSESGDTFASWNSNDDADLTENETSAMSLDQLMRFRMGDRTGHGIFELYGAGDHYKRYPNW